MLFQSRLHRHAEAKESTTCWLPASKRSRRKSSESERQREAAGPPAGCVQEDEEDRKSTNPHPQPWHEATS